MNLSNSWHLVISFLGTLGTFTAAVQTNSDLTGSGTPGWTYLVGLGLSGLTTLLVAKKADPRVQQFEAIIGELEKAVEAANAAAPTSTPTTVAPTFPDIIPGINLSTGVPSLPPVVNEVVAPVIKDVVTPVTDILSEVNKVIATFKVIQK